MPLYMQIGKFVAEIDGNVAAMRATCKHWKAGVASVATALTPLVSYLSFTLHLSLILLKSVDVNQI